jgi:hypothetical protein
MSEQKIQNTEQAMNDPTEQNQNEPKPERMNCFFPMMYDMPTETSTNDKKPDSKAKNLQAHLTE